MQIPKKPGRVSIMQVGVLLSISILTAGWIAFSVPDESDFVYRTIIPADWISPNGIVFVSSSGIDIYWGFGFGTNEFSLRKWPQSQDLSWLERCGFVLPEMRPGVRPNKLVPNQGVRIPFWLPISFLLLLEILLIKRRWRLLAPYRGVDPRCDDCGYLLKLNTSGRCPECGTTFEQRNSLSDDNTNAISRAVGWLYRRGPIGVATCVVAFVFLISEPQLGLGTSVSGWPVPPTINRDVTDIPNLVSVFDPLDAIARQVVQDFRQSKDKRFYEDEVVPQAADLRGLVREIIDNELLYRVYRVPHSRIRRLNSDVVEVIYGLGAINVGKPKWNIPFGSVPSIELHLISDKKVEKVAPFPRTRYAFVVSIGYSLDLSYQNSLGVDSGGVTDYKLLPSRLQKTRYYGVLVDSPDDLPTAEDMCKALALARNEEQPEDRLSRVSCYGRPWIRPCPDSLNDMVLTSRPLGAEQTP